ncbi:hypothetical protein BMF94_1682 [Rhodotorula taiwanensis]|uniref:peptidyl-tRNA hydrolase n=1 Tax=Rhodotorula taiwanensis TaxID=741276 RepID=A0A2S5BEX5_9BASI|nr:hypothetical protein BMF94_1682 [Rhodotorula taiwanensis]
MPASPTNGAVRRLLVAGLGNASHPLTRHSVGQLLVKNLAKRACADPLHIRGSSRLDTVKFGRHANLFSQITLRAPPSVSDQRDLELYFLVPKAAMNINGPPVVAAFEHLVPAAERHPLRRTPSPEQVAPPSPASDASSSRQSSRRSSPAPPKNLRHLVTIQDDLDLAPSKLKYQSGGGPRGHNGVRSVSKSLTSDKYHRLWVGIGRPEERSDVARYVLSPMARSEVQTCEMDDNGGRGGEVLERAWAEILRIAFAEP